MTAPSTSVWTSYCCFQGTIGHLSALSHKHPDIHVARSTLSHLTWLQCETIGLQKINPMMKPEIKTVRDQLIIFSLISGAARTGKTSLKIIATPSPSYLLTANMWSMCLKKTNKQTKTNKRTKKLSTKQSYLTPSVLLTWMLNVPIWATTLYMSVKGSLLHVRFHLVHCLFPVVSTRCKTL